MNQSSRSSSVSASTAAGMRRVAIISACWHEDIVERATSSIQSELDRLANGAIATAHFKVPGAFEIPLHAQRLARSGQFDAIIACGLVVNGGVYRHEFVASAVIDGLMQVQLQHDVPVFSVVLTPRDFHEHEDHQRFYREHFVKKGQEAAQTCLATLQSLADLPR